MKTAVSLPDDLFADAERIARRLKKPRSRLYSEAIKEYLARHDPDLIAEKLNEVMRGLEPDGGFVAAAGRKILERTDW
jgi:predicted transcriptional regulator